MYFSVIIPVYNCENTLADSVHAVACSGLEDYEILLIDDGSTDRTGAICDELAAASSEVRRIHQKNGGVSSARNLGIQEAQGEYVSFGPSAGYSWLLSKCLNFELSATVGLILGQRRHYRGEFDDNHLIWKHFGGVLYGGPTQIKASLVWLIPRKWFGLDK